MDDMLLSIKQRMHQAILIAKEYGEIIGWVSRTSPSSISEEGGLVVFDVEPHIYFERFQEIASTGNFLAIVDIKTLAITSIRIVKVERRDVIAELNLPDLTISMPEREPAGLLTKTRIYGKPLLTYNVKTGVVEASNTVIEPQSPVIMPRDPIVVQKILGLPTKGVFIGYVTTGDRPIFNASVPVYVPLKTFYQHTLILGTTGSGKTTLLKNMISAFTSHYNFNDQNTSLLIMDPNRDYVALPLKPTWEFYESIDKELEERMLKRTLENIGRPKGLVIILPITSHLVDRLVSGEQVSWPRLLKMIAEEYYESTYEPIAERMGWNSRIKEIEIIEEPGRTPLRIVKMNIDVSYGEERQYVELFIVPYGFRFKDMSPRDFISLNPYFTRQAKDGLLRLLNYLKSKKAELESLSELYEALQEARYRLREKPGTPHKGPVLNPNKEYVIELIKELAIHKSTIENMLRQIGSLIDTGLFDICVPGGIGEEKYLHEPSIGLILEKHHSLMKGYPIVVDLEYLQENSPSDPDKIISIAAFRILNKVFEWKLTMSRKRIATQPVIIIMDEAHRFFPSRGGGKEEYIEHVSGMIDRIARLGRARRLGIIFSTHSPKDVHDIILQLSNTKIILRTDKSQLSSLDIPAEYRDLILRASDRVGLLKTHALRMGYVMFRTPLPIAGHYDLSAL